jgi:ketosteroid isomerase-like protein
VSHLDLIRDGYAAYSRRDFSFVDETFAEDIDWAVAGAEPMRGRKAVLGFFDSLGERFAGHEISIDDSVESGERLVCFIHHTVTRHDGEQPPPVAAVHDWRFRDGRAVSLREVADTLAFAVAEGMIPADAVPQAP